VHVLIGLLVSGEVVVDLAGYCVLIGVRGE